MLPFPTDDHVLWMVRGPFICMSVTLVHPAKAVGRNDAIRQGTRVRSHI